MQIILRLYASPAEVLLGFDVDCCCIGYDGSNVWALPRCLRALRHQVNVVNALHAWPNRASYEFRLVKYASRGFSIAVPGLQKLEINADKIRRTPLEQLMGLGRLLSIAHQTESALLGMKQVSVLSGAKDDDEEEEEEKEEDTTGSLFQFRGRRFMMPMPVIFGDSAFKLSFYNDRFFGRSSNCVRSAAAAAKVQVRIFDPKEGKTTGAVDNVSLDKCLEVYNPRSLGKHLVNGWDLVMDASAQTDLKIPARLRDCWDSSRRSREYLNANDALTGVNIDARYASGAC